MADFKQELSVTLHQIFRSSGFTLTIKQTEDLRRASDKLADMIEAKAHEKSVELIRKVQAAFSEAFKEIGKDMSDFDERIKTLENSKNNSE